MDYEELRPLALEAIRNAQATTLNILAIISETDKVAQEKSDLWIFGILPMLFGMFMNILFRLINDFLNGFPSISKIYRQLQALFMSFFN